MRKYELHYSYSMPERILRLESFQKKQGIGIGKQIGNNWISGENGLPEPVDLSVKDCEEEPCHFHRGKDVYAEVDFTPSHDVTNMKPHVQALLLGAAINYTLPEPDGCKTLKEQQCPLKMNETYSFLLDLPILKAYPPVTFKVQLELIDTDKEETLACFKLKGKIQ